MQNPKRQLILNKGTQTFIFRYERGLESQVLDALVEQVEDRGTDFDRFDAAVLRLKLTQM